ncbi:MAG: protein jag [Actinobacteria bacterium]|nr:protein jag [Actinomycetota bacterium]
MSANEGGLEVEATGETVGEAKWQALRQLERLAPGLDRSSVRFQVVSEGERGLLGVGYSPARVLAAAEPPPAAEPGVPGDVGENGEGPAALIREVLEQITRGLGVETRIELTEQADAIVASCAGRDLAILIGRHGQTIDAIQYLVNAIARRAYPDERKEIVIDAAGYRDRRRTALDRLAVDSAEQALATGSRVVLQPMTSVERKVVHLRLQDYPGVETASEGAEPNRFVVVFAAAGDSS